RSHAGSRDNHRVATVNTTAVEKRARWGTRRSRPDPSARQGRRASARHRSPRQPCTPIPLSGPAPLARGSPVIFHPPVEAALTLAQARAAAYRGPPPQPSRPAAGRPRMRDVGREPDRSADPVLVPPEVARAAAAHGLGAPVLTHRSGPDRVWLPLWGGFLFG